MVKTFQSRFVEVSSANEEMLIAGARNAAPVRGLTHGFYKYPARFSPTFVRAAIQAFTQPGDVCLDPHVGGGTTLVESLALGRHAVGIDISSLAEFVSKVKTEVFSEQDLARLESWGLRISQSINVHKPSVQLTEYAALGYYKHLEHRDRWRLRKAIEQSLSSVKRLKDDRLEAFGRCAVLRTAQWALDGRAKQATIGGFRRQIVDVISDMIAGARAFRSAVQRYGQPLKIKILNRSAAGIENDNALADIAAPKLVVTSPPYPGVHVLYHRWQVDGRKEAPLPFMIAGRLDGAGAAYYTMGDRKNPQLQSYFDNIKKTMSSVSSLADADTIVVQMVAFSQPEWQLPRYLETMREAGLDERFLSSLRDEKDGRLWRTVPGRKWYCEPRGVTPSSQEVVLFHVRAQNATPAREETSAQLPSI